MSSACEAAAGGRSPLLLVGLAMLAVFMAALQLTRTRADPSTDTTGHRGRGRSYEAHVLAPQRLPAEIHAAGGSLRAHPVIRPPALELEARYHASPSGFGGGAIPDEAPHALAPQYWPTTGRGGIRIPDAIATWPDGRALLIELKCPSPWLTFTHGLPWAAKMQAAFASQALAFLTWAQAEPNREVVYGFCGEVPPWMTAILRDLSRRTRVAVRARRAMHVQGFPAAQAMMEQLRREATTTILETLVPDDLYGPAFDRLED